MSTEETPAARSLGPGNEPNARRGRESPTEPVGMIELVAAARRGERWAWSVLVERFLPLVLAIARGYQLNERDAEDVGQTVWLRLLENVDRIREPRALPSWLITTARHESLRLARLRSRLIPLDPLDTPALEGDPAQTREPDADLLRTESVRLLRAALDGLPAVQRNLLALMTGDEELSYRDISAMLAMPIGSIGPTRARGIARLRAMPGLRGYRYAGGYGQARPA